MLMLIPNRIDIQQVKIIKSTIQGGPLTAFNWGIRHALLRMRGNVAQQNNLAVKRVSILPSCINKFSTTPKQRKQKTYPLKAR